MSTNNASVSQQLLYAAVEKMVSERLGIILREMGELSKNLSDQGKKDARFMVLEMIKTSSERFNDKMKTRFEDK